MPINETVKLCGAKSRRRNGLPCRQPAMKNGRCRMHGGKSTGAKSEDGKQRSGQANFKHGFYSKANKVERELMQEIMKWRESLDDI